MIKTVVHPEYGMIVLNENFWTGKKVLTVNGQTLAKARKNTYILPGEGGGTLVTLKGSVLTGAMLVVNGVEIQICPKPSTLDWVLSALPLILIMVWGNNAALCAIVPVVGGAIGGLLGGLALAISLPKIQESSVAKKLLISLLATAATLAAGVALGYVMVIGLIAATV